MIYFPTKNARLYMLNVCRTARKVGRWDSLKKNLHYLNQYADPDMKGKTRVLVEKDWAPLSFRLMWQRRQEDGSYRDWFPGGLIFHGQHDGFGSGSAPTFSVSLCGADGWEIHT